MSAAAVGTTGKRTRAAALEEERSVAARRGSSSSALRSSTSSVADVVDDVDAAAGGDEEAAVPPFITKLLAMINDPDTDHLIKWSEVSSTPWENGKRARVRDEKRGRGGRAIEMGRDRRKRQHTECVCVRETRSHV